ncbi:MAG: DJ-1/PfpI family protein [Polyangiaceae bacterium]
MTHAIGMLLFPGMTQLDLTAPFEVLHRIPGAQVHLLWKERVPVSGGPGFHLTPTDTLDECPALTVLFVPGGFGQERLQKDDAVLGFLRERGKDARWVTSVCTGALVLGAAGLLEDHDATTHWAYVDRLADYGARYRPGRVVVDRNRITAGGVTAGMDFALTLAAELADERTARLIQLGLEYDPAPPFDSGHPSRAEPELVDQLRQLYFQRQRDTAKADARTGTPRN